MIFVFGLDKGFLMPTSVAIRSLDRFLTGADRIVVLSLGLSTKDKDDLAVCATNAVIEHIECAGLIDRSWIAPSHLSEAAYLRYLAPMVLADDDRCVYLDGDVVVRHDPRPLHDIDLQGRTVGAVRSRVAPFAASPGGIMRWFEIGIAGTAPYFNSGVLVIDLAKWRARTVTERLTKFLAVHGSSTWIADQEALNVAVVGDWLELDRSWNYITHIAENFLQQPELEPDDPHIAHFAGRQKPWVFGRMPLFAEDWYAILADTPWRGFRPSAPEPPKGARALMRRTISRILRRLRSLAKDQA